ATVLLLGMLAYPLGWEVWISFTDFSPLNDHGPRFVGLENYRHLLADAEFWRAVVVTVGFAAATTLAKLALGVAFALLLARPFRAVAVFLSLTTAFADLAYVWLLTAGRVVFPVVGTQAYWLALKGGQFGPASALSLMLVPSLLGLLALLFRAFDPPAEAR